MLVDISLPYCFTWTLLAPSESGQERSARTMVLPWAGGLPATSMPAARMASNLAAAVSRPPPVTAPAIVSNYRSPAFEEWIT
jgi:hypothetical protein